MNCGRTPPCMRRKHLEFALGVEGLIWAKTGGWMGTRFPKKWLTNSRTVSAQIALMASLRKRFKPESLAIDVCCLQTQQVCK